MRLAVLFHRLGPYHWARLNAAGKKGPLLALELSSETAEYAWRKVSGAGQFVRHTLFEDSRIVGHKEVRRLVWRSLGDFSPEIVAVNGWSSPEALAALAWSVYTGTPAVVMSESTANDFPRWAWKEAIKSRVVRLCSAALVGGTAHLAYLCRLGMCPDFVFTGYDVVDNDYFSAGAEMARLRANALRQELGLPENYFLASARFIPKKNLSLLLHAYHRYRLSAPTDLWDLVLLGDGDLRPDLEQLRSRLGLNRHVQMPGFKQYDELPAYYGLAKAFVHTSSTEQWGLVINEAMAAGLPVLVSNPCGCAADLVQEGENGYTFDADDGKALAGLMLKIARGGCDVAAMGRASRDIIAHWTPETFADGLSRAAQAALSVRPRSIGILDRLLLGVLNRR
jgi:1,2-diacylglycerol 3-alpha-glucosyltransferase